MPTKVTIYPRTGRESEATLRGGAVELTTDGQGNVIKRDRTGRSVMDGGGVTPQQVAAAIAESRDWNVLLRRADGTAIPFKAASDTDEARGDVLAAALTASIAGDALFVGPGTFATLAAITKSIAIIGRGIGVTVVRRTGDAATQSAVHVVARGVTFLSENDEEGAGLRASAGSSGVWENCEFIGDQDGFFGEGTHSFLGCKFSSAYDAIASRDYGAGALTADFTLVNCRLEVTTPAAWNGDAHCLIGGSAQAGSDVHMRAYGCQMIVHADGRSAVESYDNSVIEIRDAVIEGSPTNLLRTGGSIIVSGGSGSGTNGAFTTSGTVTFREDTSAAKAALLAAANTWSQNQTIEGQLLLPNQTAAASSSAMTRRLVTEESIWSAASPIPVTAASLSVSGTIAAFVVQNGVLRHTTAASVSAGAYARASVITQFSGIGTVALAMSARFGIRVVVSQGAAEAGGTYAHSAFMGTNNGSTLTARGVGYRIRNGFLSVQVHDGTILHESEVAYSGFNAATVALVLIWDGLRTASIYANAYGGTSIPARPTLLTSAQSGANITAQISSVLLQMHGIAYSAIGSIHDSSIVSAQVLPLI